MFCSPHPSIDETRSRKPTATISCRPAAARRKSPRYQLPGLARTTICIRRARCACLNRITYSPLTYSPLTPLHAQRALPKRSMNHPRQRVTEAKRIARVDVHQRYDRGAEQQRIDLIKIAAIVLENLGERLAVIGR